MLRPGLESLTFQKPYGALWSHLLLPPRLRRLSRLVAVDSKFDMEFLGRLSILHATCLDVTRMNPEYAQMPHLVSSPIRNNCLISLRLGRADAGTLEDLFKWSPILFKWSPILFKWSSMLQTLEIRDLLSVPSVLVVLCPLKSLSISQAMPAATNISLLSPHPHPSINCLWESSLSGLCKTVCKMIPVARCQASYSPRHKDSNAEGIIDSAVLRNPATIAVCQPRCCQCMLPA